MKASLLCFVRKAPFNWNFSFFSCSGLEDGSVVIWNPLEEVEANRSRILPQKHSDRVWSLSFSPDGRFLASTDSPGELIIWSTKVRIKWEKVFMSSNWERTAWLRRHGILSIARGNLPLWYRGYTEGRIGKLTDGPKICQWNSYVQFLLLFLFSQGVGYWGYEVFPHWLTLIYRIFIWHSPPINWIDDWFSFLFWTKLWYGSSVLVCL